MHVRLRLGVMAVTLVAVVQPVAISGRVTAVTGPADAGASHDVVLRGSAAVLRVAVFTRDDPTDGVLHRTWFVAVLTAVAAIAVASRRRRLRAVAATCALWSPRRAISVRGPPSGS